MGCCGSVVTCVAAVASVVVRLCRGPLICLQGNKECVKDRRL